MKLSWLLYAKARTGYDERRKNELLHVPKVVGKANSLIDFGCSIGCLLDLFPHITEKYGVEVDEEAIRICSNKGYKVLRDISEAPSVDCITMVDVIEHLHPEELIELLPKLRSHLNEGGKLFIQTYNPYCITSLMDFWNDYTHKHMWTIESLESCLYLNGFKVVKKAFIYHVNSSRIHMKILLTLLKKFLDKRYLYTHYYILAQKFP
jgi:cyclopropane fatty-acyl-phospholipid synthase-like methyltransferase